MPHGISVSSVLPKSLYFLVFPMPSHLLFEVVLPQAAEVLSHTNFLVRGCPIGKDFWKLTPSDW